MKKFGFVSLAIVLAVAVIWYELKTSSFNSPQSSLEGEVQPSPPTLRPLEGPNTVKDKVSFSQAAILETKLPPIINDLSLSKAKAIKEIEKKFKKNNGKVIENFLGSFKSIKIKDYPVGKDVIKEAHSLLKENKELLWGPPTGSTFYFESLRASAAGKLAVFSIKYKGFIYPGKKVLYFKKGPSSDLYTWNGINDTSEHLKSIRECDLLSKDKVLDLLRSFHKDPVPSLIGIEKVITPGPEFTGITTLEATYFLKENGIMVKTYSAIIDLCSQEVTRWRPVEKTL